MNNPEQDFLDSVLDRIAGELVYAKEKNPTSKTKLNTLSNRIVYQINKLKREIK